MKGAQSTQSWSLTFRQPGAIRILRSKKPCLLKNVSVFGDGRSQFEVKVEGHQQWMIFRVTNDELSIGNFEPVNMPQAIRVSVHAWGPGAFVAACTVSLEWMEL